MPRPHALAATAAVVLAATLLPAARGDVVTFTKLADSATATPGGAGTFTRFTFPALSGGTATFIGGDANDTRGVYRSTGGVLSTVADTNTVAPGSGGRTFEFFESPAVGGGRIAFGGTYDAVPGDLGSAVAGLYTAPAAGGAVSRVFDATTASPGGGRTFTDVFSPSINAAGTIAFGAVDDGPFRENYGVYTTAASGGPLTTIADGATAIPGRAGQTFGFATAATIDDTGAVAFRGDNGSFGDPDGLYLNTAAGGLAEVARIGDAIPGTAETFDRFSLPTVDGGQVVFQGQADGGNFSGGIYRGTGGALEVLADTSGADGDGAPFLAFGQSVAADGGNVAFTAFTGTSAADVRESLYLLREGGDLLRIIGTGETLDGKTLNAAPNLTVAVGRGGLDGNTLAFAAYFEDGSQGLYLASFSPAAVPEPTTLALLALAAVGGVARRRAVRPGRVPPRPAG